MVFNSVNFLVIFLPIVLAGYYLLRGTRFASAFMLVASLFFYAAGAVWFLLPMLFSALVDYFVGQKIYDSDDPVYRKRMLIWSVVINLGLLSIFKYTNWVSAEVASIFAFFGVTIGTISLPLPAGISFYTFQSMSYAIDIYRREFKPHRNVIHYLSFVSFFPHLVAGPIMRAKVLLTQLAAYRKVPTSKEVSAAFFMILFGLFQKTVVADNLGALVETITNLMGPKNSSLPPGVGLLFMYGFAIQIYCDFAAYSTIARGVAKLFNVDLVHNFVTPYLAVNPSDFWQRWHISLSTWLRDYLYIPLGGNRHGKWMTMRNLMITMVLGGLWHGAGLSFVLWGFYHGLLLIIYRAFPIDQYLSRWFGQREGKFLSIVLMFHLTCFGWIFFRATPGQFGPIWSSILALPQAFLMHIWDYVSALRNMESSGFLNTTGSMIYKWINQNWYLTIYGWGFLLFSSSIVMTDVLAWFRNKEFPDLFPTFSTWTKVATILFLIYAIQFFGRRDSNEFIYFAF